MPFLRTLGLPEVVRDDGRPVGGLRLKDLALLAYLCVEGGRAHPRGRLAGLLWGESPEELARHSFTQAVGRIQKVLGRGALCVQKESVRWTGCVASDAGALLADDPWHPCLDDGLALYRSDFLEGFEPGEGGEDFDRWAEGTRARLRNLALRALERRGEDAEVRGEWERALRIGERAVQIDRLWEHGHRRVMRALAERGELNRALRHYEAFRTWLAEEVGGAPDPETRCVAERLRARGDGAGEAADAPGGGRRARGRYTAGAGFAPWNREREVIYVILLVLPALLAFSVVDSLVLDSVRGRVVPEMEGSSVWLEAQAPPRATGPQDPDSAWATPVLDPVRSGGHDGTRVSPATARTGRNVPSVRVGPILRARPLVPAREASPGLPSREPSTGLASSASREPAIGLAPPIPRPSLATRVYGEAPAQRLESFPVVETYPPRAPGTLIRGPDGTVLWVLHPGAALRVPGPRVLATHCRTSAEAEDVSLEEFLSYRVAADLPPAGPPCAPWLR